MSLLWTSKRLAVISPAQPVLLVALIGFEPAREAEVAALFAQCTALGASWRTAPAANADLWIVDGATLLLDNASRPTAFAEPLHADLDARFRFDPAVLASLHAMLSAMAPWLGPKVAQQALVAHLIANGGRLARSTVIQVHDQGRLIAVMDFAGETGVATDATPAAIQRADWHARPATAGFVPSMFHRAPTEEVLWRFATRVRDAYTLPARYLRLPIYLRRVPGLPAEELSSGQAAIIDEVSNEGRTLHELQARLAMDEVSLVRDLAALHLVGAITCDPMRSLVTGERRRRLHLVTDWGQPFGADTSPSTMPAPARPPHTPPARRPVPTSQRPRAA